MLTNYPSPHNRFTRVSDYECFAGGNGCLDDHDVVVTKPKLFIDGLIDAIGTSKVATRAYLTDNADNPDNTLWQAMGSGIMNRIIDGQYTIEVFDSPVDPEKKIFIIGDYATLSKSNFELVLPVTL